MTSLTISNQNPAIRPAAMSASMASLLSAKSRYLMADDGTQMALPAAATLSISERGALETRSEALRGALQASGPEPIKARLHALIGVLPSPQTDSGNADAKVKVYQLALARLPAWAVIEACDMALRGKVGGSGGRYLPAPGELYAAAEQAMAWAAREKAQIDRLLRARVESRPLSPEDRAEAVARVKAHVAEFAAAKTIDASNSYERRPVG